ncbi:hypothetical protein BH11PSE2_BH11PSE2_05840 [soil metagenome]
MTTVWEVPLKTRELFVGLRLEFADPGVKEVADTVNAGDQVRFQREGHDGIEGRVLQTSAKGVVLELNDLTRWLMTPVTYTEKRRSKPVEQHNNVWIIRERLP